MDTALGRITMYRLTLMVLAVLATYSLVLELLGWLTFGFPEMAAHLVICLGATYAANKVMAALFRVPPHPESSLITGLLLYFLFWPSFRPLDLAGTLLACVLASLSKYVLAWRGRHIFNPAAAGAFLAGLTGLNIATWWAATPAMLIVVVPGVLLVLYRMGKLRMAGVFLAMAAGIITVELLGAGMSAGQAMWQALAQRPLLFFVGFMLTEPLTLPPRRWQQLALAAVVGAIFAVPYNLGFVANSPELALLVGNIVAFLVGQRGSVDLAFVGAESLTATTREFSFRPSRPVRFQPGQYLEVDLPHARSDGKGRRRVFSLAGSPREPLIRFAVRTSEPVSAAKGVLLALKPGDRLRATTVGGDFLLPRDTAKPVLLIAAGIGITPFMSYLRSGELQRRDALLIVLARNQHEVPFADELRRAHNAGVRTIIRATGGLRADSSIDNSAGDDVAGNDAARDAVDQSGAAVSTPSGQGSPGWLDAAGLADLVPEINDREVYISGSPSSVASLRAAARQAGARRVHTDSFAGY
ncbi:FAD-dependent oxidoreductase [Pseudarthrobacter sp. NPDC058362]|uniref:FAD-dependent oxidoreductase n=1 Tax=Pseudarthrobacter sp. NPDC058362 TaxID=3346458 RepID=UPI00365DBB00